MWTYATEKAHSQACLLGLSTQHATINQAVILIFRHNHLVP